MARIVQETNTLTSPAWAADFLNREHLVPGGAKLLASAFFRSDSVLVATTAQAAAAATSIAVTALTGAIPNGTMLFFGEAGEYARLTSAAAAGATSLAVEALPAQIESGDTARYEGVSTTRTVPSGTLLGRTIAEREAGTAYGPWATGDDEVYLLAFDVTDPTVSNDCELYRNFSIVKENFLPAWTTLWTAGMKTALRAAYRVTTGVA